MKSRESLKKMISITTFLPRFLSSSCTKFYSKRIIALLFVQTRVLLTTKFPEHYVCCSVLIFGLAASQ